MVEGLWNYFVCPLALFAYGCLIYDIVVGVELGVLQRIIVVLAVLCLGLDALSDMLKYFTGG